MTERSIKGINWGTLEIDDKNMLIESKGKQLMKVPLSKVNNATVNKNDIVMELKTEDLNDDEDLICEMRFYIPPQAEKEKNDDDEDKSQKSQKSQKSNKSQEEEQEEKEQQQSYIDILHQEIIEKAQIGQFSGLAIATIQEVPLVVPRGRYSVDFYAHSVRFHGMSFNYMIEYKNITRAFLLTDPNEMFMHFVIGLDQPVKQGNTVYPYLVIQFRKDAEEIIKINLKPEEIKDYPDLQDEYDGLVYEICATLFKIIVGINIIVPGNFKSSDNHQALKCTLKTHQGHLYPLQKSLIFLNKPVVYIQLVEIVLVEFLRIGSGNLNKMFDVKINTKNNQIQFLGIDRKELDNLINYFQTRKIQIRKLADEMKADMYDNESEDESVSQDMRDRNKRKSAIAAKANVKRERMQMQDDDDDEEDESFDANEFESESSDADFDEEESVSQKDNKKKSKDKKKKGGDGDDD